MRGIACIRLDIVVLHFFDSETNNFCLQVHFAQMPEYKAMLTSKAKVFQKLVKHARECVDIDPLESRLSEINQRFIVSKDQSVTICHVVVLPGYLFVTQMVLYIISREKHGV